MSDIQITDSNKLFYQDTYTEITLDDQYDELKNPQLYMRAHNLFKFNDSDFAMFHEQALQLNKGAIQLDKDFLTDETNDDIQALARAKLYQNLLRNNELPKDAFNEEGQQIKPLTPDAGTLLIKEHPKAILLLEDSHRTSAVNQKIAITSMIEYFHTFEDGVKDDREIAMWAIKHDPRLLEFVSDRLKDDKYVVYEAIKEYPEVITCASENMQNLAGKDDPVAGIERAINSDKLHAKLNRACTVKNESVKRDSPKMKI